MQSSTVQQAQELTLCRERLSKSVTVVAILHSHGPQHYTMLRAVQRPSGRAVSYYDSLNAPSVNALAVANKFLDTLGWGQCPAPANLRYQPPMSVSCGQFCLQFLEEAIREARHEAVVKGPSQRRQGV